MRPIDADALKEKAWDADTRCGYVQVVDVGDIDEAPTIELERNDLYAQLRWERDTAIAQLAKIGKGFGEQMDDVVVRKKGKWITTRTFQHDGELYVSVALSVYDKQKRSVV